MIIFVLAINVCWSVVNCEWRTIGAFVNEEECTQVGHDYAKDETVIGYRCVITMPRNATTMPTR